jgi:hypothetical protein
MRIFVLLMFLWQASTLWGQSEAALKSYFEGKYVRSKIELPGTHDGLDIRFRQNPPFDPRTHQRRLAEWGAAVPTGTEIMVSLIRVKGKNIEFQLGGGGLNESASVSFSTYVSPSSYERDLERDIKKETDSKRKAAMQRDLDRARDSRRREERRLEAEKARLEAIKRQELREKAYRYGSRINIWFQNDYLKETVPTPQELMQMLDEYVDFSAMSRNGAPVPPPTQATPTQPTNGWGRASVSGLTRGMTVDAVHRLLGNPERYRDSREGSINLRTEAWDYSAETVEVDFAEGVVLRWRVSSK